MPHTQDKSAFGKAMELLEGPKHLHYAARRNGRRLLDAKTTGQQRFQAMLFECLHTERGRHPFESSTKARPFVDIRDGYLGWVSFQPEPESLIVHCTLASRVAAFLLPHSRIFPDGSWEYAGIPGLRVEAVNSGYITLVHLPTGGVLKLHEYSNSMKALASSLKSELETTDVRTDRIVRNGEHAALWALKKLDPTEHAAEKFWAITPRTPVLSGLMTRARPLWQQAEDLTIQPPRRSSSALRLQWRGGASGDAIVELLAGDAIGFPGATVVQDRSVGSHMPDPILFRLGDVQVELDPPWRPRALHG